MISDIAILFGRPYGKCNPGCCVTGIFSDVQVFESHMLDEFYEQLRASSTRGGPAYVHMNLNVIANEQQGVPGGWTTELLFMVLAPSRDWQSQLPADVRKQVEAGQSANPTGPFEHFPNYLTQFENSPNVVQLTKPQINLLANFTEWCITHPEIAAIVNDMFGLEDSTQCACHDCACGK